MYPDLSYLFHRASLAHSQITWLSIFKTFGFFLALAFLVSALVFSIELKRKAREGVYQPTIMTITEGLPASMGDLLGNAFVGLLMGGKGLYAYQHFTDFRQDPASIVLSAKMHWPAAIIGAVLLAAFTSLAKSPQNPPVVRQVNVFPHHRISEMTVAAPVGGITGAKLFDIFDNWESFVADPIGSLTGGDWRFSADSFWVL